MSNLINRSGATSALSNFDVKCNEVDANEVNAQNINTENITATGIFSANQFNTNLILANSVSATVLLTDNITVNNGTLIDQLRILPAWTPTAIAIGGTWTNVKANYTRINQVVTFHINGTFSFTNAVQQAHIDFDVPYTTNFFGTSYANGVASWYNSSSPTNQDITGSRVRSVTAQQRIRLELARSSVAAVTLDINIVGSYLII